MLSKFELIAELKNIMRTMGSIVFESSVIQNDIYVMMVEVVCDELKDGGLFCHRLKKNQQRLDIVLSHFDELVKRSWERNIKNG